MTFTTTIALCVADRAAWAIASARDLVHHEDGSRAVEVVRLDGLPRWRVALQVDADYSERERCLTIDVLRHRIEVFYRPGRVSVPV